MNKDPGYQAFIILKYTTVIFMIFFGLDKFFNFLDSWDKYFSFSMLGYFGTSNTDMLLKVIGVFEILLAIGLIYKTRVFAYLTAIFTFLVFINILMSSHFYGVGLRDLYIGLVSIAMARMTHIYDEKRWI